MATQTLRRRLWKTPMRDLIRGRVTGRLDLDALLEQSDLPAQAADKVRAVVKRTRLWRLEKIDVANELIAHFQDGQDAQTPLDEMIESFGDETQAARLIRRAKKRQRPILWHAFRWSRRAVGALIVIYLGLIVYFLAGSPQVKVNYLAKFNARAEAVPQDQRAWPLYRKALLALDLKRVREWDSPAPYYQDLPPEQQDEHWDQMQPPFRSSQMDRLSESLHPGDPGWSDTAEFLQSHQDELSLIRQGAMRQGMGFAAGFPEDFTPEDRKLFQMQIDPEQLNATHSYKDPDHNLIGVLLPHLSPMRSMARLIAADARLAATEDDAARTYDDLAALQGLADQSREVPCLIGELVGIAIRTIGYQTTSDLLTQHPDLLTNDQLQQLAHRYASADLSLLIGMEGERTWFHDIVQRMYTDDGHGDGHMTEEGLKLLNTAMSMGGDDNEFLGSTGLNALIGPVSMMGMASRKEMVDTYNRLIDKQIAALDTPLWQTTIQPVDDEIEHWSQIKQARYFLISYLMPALGAVRKAGEAARGQREGILIGIALQMYHRDHGDWPKTLNALKPKYLPTVPIDRINGKPLHYHVTDTGPLVYSVGVDEDDDGGRPPTDKSTGKPNNYNACPRQFTGEPVTDPENDGDWVLWPMPSDR